MYNQVKLQKTLASLISWLETWKTDEGGYNGFVIHRTEAKRMRFIHDTAWTQAAMIRGYANLYKKSREKRWYDSLKKASELQYKRYDKKSGKYDFAGHEDDRFCSLVHCALANCALLEAGPLLGDSFEKKYIEVIVGNVELYWLPKLWVEEEGAFRFNEVDYLSPNEHRFVINFNTMAIECLLKLFYVTKNEKYKNIALQVGQWLIKKCELARDFSKKAYQNKFNDKIISKGLPYQYSATLNYPDNCVTLYAGLALRGIAEIYSFTKSDEYRKILEDTLVFLCDMRDPDNNLFFHTTRQNNIEKYPQFTSGVGMILVGVYSALQAINKKDCMEDTLNSILNLQYKNGGLPSFIGKNKSTQRNGSGVVWEDAVAAVNWNAQMFEALTMIIDKPDLVKIPSFKKNNIITKLNFFYYDSENTNIIISWWPIRSAGFYFMKKKKNYALALSASEIYSKTRNFIGNNKIVLPL